MGKETFKVKKKLLIVLLTMGMALSACGQSPGAKILKTIASSASDEVKKAKTGALPEEESEEQSKEEESQEQSKEADTADGTQAVQETAPEQEPAAEQEAGQETGSGEYERGIVTQDAWESEFWNLRFTPPQGLSMLGEEELNNMMGLGEEMLSQNFSEKQVEYAQMMNVYEMMSTNLTGDANVVVTTEKLLASGFSSEDYLQAMKRTVTSITTISYTVLEEGQTYQIGDDTFGVMKVMGEGSGMVMYQDYYALVKGNRALAIAITYTDDTAQMAGEMIEGFEKY